MGNAPSPLRSATLQNDVRHVEQILKSAGSGAADVINEDHAQDCIMQSCTPAIGNAFYYAVMHNRVQVVTLMLQHGADVHSTGKYGETCVHCAARRNYVQAARILINGGCDVYATDDAGRYAINSCGMTVYNTSEMIDFLLTEAGQASDVNRLDFQGRTALHEAATCGNVEAVRALLRHGADTSIVSKAGNTPRQCAQSAKVVALLDEHSANSAAAPQQNVAI